jgi:hypothetical protein
MSDLRDFFQGASNSIASNVSAPVDGIAWLLRKAGVPVPPNPMGGSDWMAEKGLTQQPQNRTAGLLGEFAGMTAPMVAAAKAPQIAKGLLSLDDKAMDMGRSALENHMVKNGMIQPATVWHGSPHKFNKFDSSKIGTGEGAQAYGHGLYLAENPKVAGQYQKDITALKMPTDSIADAEVAAAKKMLNIFGEKDGLVQVRRMFGDRADDVVAKANAVTGQLYKVDLPDEAIAKMLDWDKPLSQQAPEVQAAVKQIRPNIGSLASTINGKLQPAMNQTGEDFIEWMGRGHADRLRENGIPGIRYLDGGSRGTGTGTSNYVVFPGNEDILKILERNGKGLLE